MTGTVYILKSYKNDTYYIGSTNNLPRRLNEHVSSKSRYTKNILPIELVFSQNFPSLTIARKIEYKLKKLKRKDIIKNIIETKIIKLGP
jgi:putative endonuclease